jgi:hypothetical protein
MPTPTDKHEIVIPRFRWDQMQGDLQIHRIHVAQLNEEKRRLIEVIACLILQAGGKVVVTPETMQKFSGKLNIQIMQQEDGSMSYEVFDPEEHKSTYPGEPG